MTIRLLRPGEAGSYREIRRRALAEAPQFVGPLGEREAVSTLEELEARMTAYPEEGVRVFGCFLDDTCVAVAGLNRNPNPKYAHKMFLWGLYVLPEHRGRSVGGRFLTELLDFARAQEGVRLVNLQVTTTNGPAKALYLKHGFSCYGIEPTALFLGGQFHDFEFMQSEL